MKGKMVRRSMERLGAGAGEEEDYEFWIMNFEWGGLGGERGGGG